jgi:hypothetical protein
MYVHSQRGSRCFFYPATKILTQLFVEWTLTVQWQGSLLYRNVGSMCLTDIFLLGRFDRHRPRPADVDTCRTVEILMEKMVGSILSCSQRWETTIRQIWLERDVISTCELNTSGAKMISISGSVRFL